MPLDPSSFFKRPQKGWLARLFLLSLGEEKGATLEEGKSTPLAKDGGLGWLRSCIVMCQIGPAGLGIVPHARWKAEGERGHRRLRESIEEDQGL